MRRAARPTIGPPISPFQQPGAMVDSLGFGNDSTSDGIMGGSGLRGAFFGSHSRSANDSSFGLVARSDASFGKPPIDNLTADVKTIGDGINAFAVIERFENAIRHWNALAACLDAIAFEYTKNGCITTSDFLDNLFGSSTRLIEIDDVESVSFSERSCHVYNLSTKGGWYVSSGIITHNCDCRVIPSWDRKNPSVQGYDPKEYYDMYEHPENYPELKEAINARRRQLYAEKKQAEQITRQGE